MKSLSDRPVYLISDLHLEAGRPGTTGLLLDFLSGPARRARSLYILGDLFEVWIGDDGADELAETVAAAISRLAAAGTPVYFIPGNRDFLVGQDYCRAAGMQALEEPVLLEGLEPKTALVHGDSLCTDDVEYQRFRQRVRHPKWQARVLSRPLWWRRLLARAARGLSKRRNRGKAPEIMDVNADAVRRCFQILAIARLVHGHTHRPGRHQLDIDGRACERIVLGDWHGERGSVVELQGRAARLLILSRDEHGRLQMQPA